MTKNFKIFSRIAIFISALCGLQALSSCDKLPGSGETDHLEDEYVAINSWFEDWSGDYIIAHKDAEGDLLPLSGISEGKGTAGKKLIALDGVVFGSEADATKAVLMKEGEYYLMHLAGTGYVGFDGKGSFVSSSTAGTGDAYLWEVLMTDGGEGYVQLCPKTSSDAIVWNGEGFSVAADGETALLYRRVLGTGIKDNPSTDPDKPSPDPTPDPEPTPGPTVPTNAKYGWFELPAVNYELTGGKYLVDKTDKSLYFAHHICAGGEKGPNGKTARNYTVCYSAEEHCPVWVAAPRHRMYESGANRTNAYGKDPDIPSDIQYNSKSTGGGCNKGHMLGSAERISTTATNRQVFYYTNIAPQLSSTFNTGGGAWNNLEDHVDGLVCSDTLYEVVGCYFKQFKDAYGEVCNPQTISFGSRNDVTRPSMFYYVLLRTKKGNTNKPVSQCSASELQCVAFVIRHNMEKGHKPQAKDMMSVSDLEKLTGFSYFPNVPNAPKNTFNAQDWL